MYHTQSLNVMLLIEDKDIFVSSGKDGTRFWNISNDYSQIKHFKGTFNELLLLQ